MLIMRYTHCKMSFQKVSELTCSQYLSPAEAHSQKSESTSVCNSQVR